MVYHGMSHLSLAFSWDTNKVTGGIFYGTSLKSIGSIQGAKLARLHLLFNLFKMATNKSSTKRGVSSCQYTCWKRLENDKFPLVDLPLSPEKTRVDAPKITLPTEKQNGFPNGIEFGEGFRFNIPSSIQIMGPSGCGKTCFTESVLLDELQELFVNPPPMIHYCYRVWQDDSKRSKMLVYNFTRRFQSQTISSCGLARIDLCFKMF